MSRIDITSQGFTKASTYTLTVDQHFHTVLEGISQGTITFSPGNPFGKRENSYSLPIDFPTTTQGRYQMSLTGLRNANGEPVGGPLDTLSGSLQVNPKPVED